MDASGFGAPSAVDAGLVLKPVQPVTPRGADGNTVLRVLPGLLFIGSGVGFIAWLLGARPAGWRVF